MRSKRAHTFPVVYTKMVYPPCILLANVNGTNTRFGSPNCDRTDPGNIAKIIDIRRYVIIDVDLNSALIRAVYSVVRPMGYVSRLLLIDQDRFFFRAYVMAKRTIKTITGFPSGERASSTHEKRIYFNGDVFTANRRNRICSSKRIIKINPERSVPPFTPKKKTRKLAPFSFSSRAYRLRFSPK